MKFQVIQTKIALTLCLSLFGAGVASEAFSQGLSPTDLGTLQQPTVVAPIYTTPSESQYIITDTPVSTTISPGYSPPGSAAISQTITTQHQGALVSPGPMVQWEDDQLLLDSSNRMIYSVQGSPTVVSEPLVVAAGCPVQQTCPVQTTECPDDDCYEDCGLTNISVGGCTGSACFVQGVRGDDDDYDRDITDNIVSTDYCSGSAIVCPEAARPNLRCVSCEIEEVDDDDDEVSECPVVCPQPVAVAPTIIPCPSGCPPIGQQVIQTQGVRGTDIDMDIMDDDLEIEYGPDGVPYIDD